MRNRQRLPFLLLALLFGGLANAQPVMEYRHHAPEFVGDTRYLYHWRVLRSALELTREDFGDYRLQPANLVMNESRQIVEITSGTKQLNVMVLDSTAELEQTLKPVRIPIDKGLLGYRVLLIRAEDQPRFAQVQSLDQLKSFSIGQGRSWSDMRVYKHAGFRTVGGASYEGLFGMLMAGRFDAFGRGVSEVLGELSTHQARYPQMRIEQSLLLYYPMPVYFWFAPDQEGQRLRQRVEQGMRQMLDNGELDRLFLEEYGPVIEKLKLSERRLFVLKNPNLLPVQPFEDDRLWFRPLTAESSL